MKCGYPKKKGKRERFRYPAAKQIKLDEFNARLFLPKLGWLRYRKSRRVLGEVKNATVSLKAGRGYVSIQAERAVEAPPPRATTAVGIDVGIRRFATFDRSLPEFGGRDHIAALNRFKKHERALRKAQQALSRKARFSRDWRKAKAKVQRINARIGNVRQNFLHPTTHAISQNHAIVFVEDLNVQGMSRSAKGTVEAPGKNVKAKSGLNKSILDQGWGEFRRQLGYKLAWAGGQLLAVPARNTSRTCPACRHVEPNNRRSQASFWCVVRGYSDNADAVAAVNILRAGHARLACEVNGAVRPSAAGTHRGRSGALAPAL